MAIVGNPQANKLSQEAVQIWASHVVFWNGLASK